MYSVLKTRVELKLVKAVPNHWVSLETRKAVEGKVLIIWLVLIFLQKMHLPAGSFTIGRKRCYIKDVYKQ